MSLAHTNWPLPMIERPIKMSPTFEQAEGCISARLLETHRCVMLLSAESIWYWILPLQWSRFNISWFKRSIKCSKGNTKYVKLLLLNISTTENSCNAPCHCGLASYKATCLLSWFQLLCMMVLWFLAWHYTWCNEVVSAFSVTLLLFCAKTTIDIDCMHPTKKNGLASSILSSLDSSC